MAPVHTAFFFTSPGSVHLGDEVGHVGRRAHVHAGDSASAIIEAGVRSTLAVLDNIEKTFAAMPPR